MPRSTRLGGRVAAALFSTPLALQLSVSFHLAAALGAQIDWRQQNTFSVTPVGRDFAAMAYDPAAGGLLLFGGQATGAITSQNLRWTSVGWQRLTPAVSPPPRSGHALASDTSRNVIVLFGGWDGTVPGPNMPFQYFDDTWEWNGSNWLQRSPVIVPTARHLHVMAYDSARRRTVLTSGWTDRDSGRLLYDTWEWDGTAWGERTPVHPAPAFSGATTGILQLVTSWKLSPLELIDAMLLELLVLGCFVDQLSMIMITLPFFMPLAKAMGIDLVWFGILMLLMLEISFTTPPFGMLLFVMKGVAPPGVTMRDIYVSAAPFVLLVLLVVCLVVAFPEVATWLPRAVSAH